MLEYNNPHTGERYVLRAVPVQEALDLRARGVVFYDNTKIVAVDTCPTFGVLRYARHKTETSIGGRNLAIECGSACHDFFAALRMWTLLQKMYSEKPKDGTAVMMHSLKYEGVLKHGEKLFGPTRWNSMLSQPQDSEPLTNAITFALDALHTSGYFDDPNDRKRTMANMEVACITYTHRYFQSELPIYVKDDFIGVEIPFVIEIKRYRKGPTYYTTEDGGGKIHGDSIDTYYYCGRIDGVHVYGDNVTAGENKTASRPDSVWRSSFHMSSQVTGYNIALSTLLNVEVADALIMGVQIPVPTRDIYSGIAFEPVRRTVDDKLRWFEWFFHGVSVYENYPDPTLAPRYTHSCNRYFSTCQFLPFCTMTREEQREMLDGMRTEEWSPLDHIVEAKESVDG